MTHLVGPHFSTADFGEIPTLEKSLLDHSPHLREVAKFKQAFLEPDDYLDWLMNEVTTQVYGVTHAGSPRRERGSGRRKIGAHSEGKHR